MAYQSLYRRYRPQTFAQIRGQQHVVSALRTAVAEGRTSHAYLFSGPRGTGKTTTARILAKALNCPNVEAGEPCGTCDSCVAIETGKSFDLHELDAASNNKVDDMRDLIAKVHLGTPGRSKVYILDEVHMLSTGAENALLKTLEEPPDHVVFVLATTEPHKVVPTIRSRTQHFEFGLLGGDELADHLRFVIDDAGLAVDDAAVDYALRQGGGSARDTLSALDLVAAAGGAPDAVDIGHQLADAITSGDAGGGLSAVQSALEVGREPRVIGEETIEVLRNAFLAVMGSPLTHLSESARQSATDRASRTSPAALTRALEQLGSALVEMRQAPDPRIPLEVAIVGLANREGNDLSSLLARLEALEAEVAALRVGGAPTATPAGADHSLSTGGVGTTEPPPPAARRRVPAEAPTPAPAPSPASGRAADSGADTPPPPRRSGAERARAKLRAVPPPADDAPPPPAPEPAPSSPSSDSSASAPSAPAAAPASPGGLSVAAIRSAMDSPAVAELPQRVRARFNVGSFTSVDGTTATFTVPNEHFRSRCQEVAPELGAALAATVGPIEVTVVVGEGEPPDPSGSTPSPNRPAPTDDADDDIGPVDELKDADVTASGIDRLTEAFPGSVMIEEPGD